MHPSHPSSPAFRDQFAAMRVETASNAQILTLCFDRLDRDLSGARTAIEEADHFTANEVLRHAQDLIGELAMMLDIGAWEHAGSLLAVYDYLLRLLATANIYKADSLVAEAQTLVTEIGNAFREAATAAPAPEAPTPGAFADDEPAAPRWSVQA